MEKNETTVVKQPQDSANNNNLKEWARPEMLELKVNDTFGTGGLSSDGDYSDTSQS